MKDDNQPVTPFAILYLPEAKGGQSLMIYGRSGTRYSFAPSSEVNNKPARIYHDPALFEKEERDLRKNPKPMGVICTSVGPVDPVVRVESALSQLIGSRQQLGAGGVREALRKLVTMTYDALLDLDKTVSGGAPADDSQPLRERLKAAAEKGDIEQVDNILTELERAVMVQSFDRAPVNTTNQTSPPNPSTSADSQKASNEPIPVLNEPSLQVLPIDELKELAKKRGVSGRSREALVAGILEKQAATA